MLFLKIALIIGSTLATNFDPISSFEEFISQYGVKIDRSITNLEKVYI